MGKLNHIFVVLHLPLDGGNLPLEHHNRRSTKALLHHGRGIAGKALAVGLQPGGALQIDMVGIFLEAACLVDRFSQKGKCSIAM